MNFYSNLNILSLANPNFEGKWSHFVAVLAQNTCLCGCRPGLYYSKVNIGWLGRLIKPGMATMVNFPVQPHHFCKASPHFGGKWTSFVAILTQNTWVYGCRLILDQFKYNISLLSRFMKPMMEIIDEFLLQPQHFLSSKSQFWRKMNSFCVHSGPKHMFVWL